MPSIERRVAYLFLLLLPALVINGVIAYRATRVLIANESRVAQTLQALNGLEATRSALVDAETGQRGFIITGSEEYLEPYHAAVASMDARLDSLAAFIGTDSAQQRRFRELRDQARRKIAELELVIEARRTPGFEAARRMVLTHRGRTLMNQVRETVARMEDAENTRLVQRTGESTAAAGGAKRAVIVATGVAGLALALVVVIALLGFAERRRAEEAIRQQREWLRTTLASIGDAVITTDTMGTIDSMNPVAQRLTGWTLEEARGRPLESVFRIVNELTRESVASPARRAIQEGTIVGLANHTVLIAKDGSEIPIDDSGAPIKTESGKVIGAVLVFRDITERRRAERYKDDFLAIASHELRTPITAIRLQVQIVERAIAESKEGPHLAALAATLNQDTRRLGALVDGLLDVTRIASGQFALHPEDADLREIVRSSMAVVQSELPAQAELMLQADAPLPGRWDRVRLEQVVTNLLSNAIRYGEGRPITVTATGTPDEIELSVKDLGRGIAPEMLPKVFDRFARGASSPHGLGLGLYVARRIVEGHGGRIEVSSVPGAGTTFTVRLPREAQLRA